MKRLLFILGLGVLLGGCVTVEKLAENRHVDNLASVPEGTTFAVRSHGTLEVTKAEESFGGRFDRMGWGEESLRIRADPALAGRLTQQIEGALVKALVARDWQPVETDAQVEVLYYPVYWYRSDSEGHGSHVIFNILIRKTSDQEVVFDNMGIFRINDRFIGEAVQAVVDQVLAEAEAESTEEPS